MIRELEAKLYQLGQELTNQQAGQIRLSEEKSNMERQAELLNVELENITKR